MEIIKADTQWFFSNEGINAFKALQSLEDRSVFIYSYLKTVVDEQLEKDNLIFKTAFFIADTLHGSALPYANYPELINKTKNPFVAYLVNLKKPCEQKVAFCHFIAILQGLVNPFNSSEWIYDKEWSSTDKVKEKLTEIDRFYLPLTSVDIVDPSKFEIDADLQPIQLKMIWMFYDVCYREDT